MNTTTSSASGSESTGLLLLLENNDWALFGEWIRAELAKFGTRLLYALIFLLFGYILIRIVLWLARRALNRKGLDKTAMYFMLSCIGALLKSILAITFVTMLNIDMLSATALLASVGIAVGLALTGMINNCISGGYLAIYKPVSVGDYVYIPSSIEAVEGEVHSIDVLNTTIRIPDGRHCIVPNTALSNGQIINASKEKQRRVEQEVAVPWDEDMVFVKRVLMRLAKHHPLASNDPEPNVRFMSLSSDASSVRLQLRVWAPTTKFWEVHFGIREVIKAEFDRCGIKFQIPQTHVVIDSNSHLPQQQQQQQPQHHHHHSHRASKGTILPVRPEDRYSFRRSSKFLDPKYRAELEEAFADDLSKKLEAAESQEEGQKPTFDPFGHIANAVRRLREQANSIKALSGTSLRTNSMARAESGKATAVISGDEVEEEEEEAATAREQALAAETESSTSESEKQPTNRKKKTNRQKKRK